MTKPRTPEPQELMDDDEQARAYAVADFSDVNEDFAQRCLQLLHDATDPSIIDLGCGPADIPLRLCQARTDMKITAVDGSEAMLQHARQLVTEAGLTSRIELVRATLPGVLPDRTFDAVVSNSLLHHLEDPLVLWRETKRLAKPDAAILVIDLLRPESEERARAIVEENAADEHPLLKHDFYASLLAAYTLEEVEQQLQECGFEHLGVEQISDRHLAVSTLKGTQ